MSIAIDEPRLVREARKELVALEKELGPRLTTDWLAHLRQMWREALKKDPEGSQLKPLIQDFRERLTPMRT